MTEHEEAIYMAGIKLGAVVGATLALSACAWTWLAVDKYNARKKSLKK